MRAQLIAASIVVAIFVLFAALGVSMIKQAERQQRQHPIVNVSR